MTQPIQSWAQALAANALTSEQLAVLQSMCDAGEAETLEAAASMLDWQDHIINPDEHMYGF
jgi:hypothetical protein